MAIVLLLGVPLARTALASKAPGPAALVTEALAHNPDLKAARLEVAVSRAMVGHVGTWPDPKLGGGLMLMEMGSGLPQPTLPSLTYSQSILDPGQLGFRVQAARHAADASAADARALANRIARQVVDTYADAAYTDGALAENQASAALTRELVQVATGRYAAGQGTMGDVLRAQAELSRLADARDSLEQRRTASLATLGALLGRSGPVPEVASLTVVASPLPVSSHGQIKASAGDWPTRIASASPQSAAARAEAAAMQSQLGLARLQRVAPSYGAQIGVGLWNPGNQPYVSGMVTVSLPWLAPVRFDHLVHHAEAHAAAARARVQATTDRLRAEAIVQSAALARDRQQVALYEQGIIPQLEAAYRSSLAAYPVGKAHFADLMAEERDLYRAHLLVLRGLTRQYQAQAALEALAGDYATGAGTAANDGHGMGAMDGQQR